MSLCKELDLGNYTGTGKYTSSPGEVQLRWRDWFLILHSTHGKFRMGT